MKNFSGIRVLYIEDDPPLANLFKLVLEEHDCIVDIAYKGNDGLLLCAKTPYDLIAISYQIPDMNGLDIARLLLADAPDIPILMISASKNNDLVIEAMTLGISYFVNKGDEKVYLEFIPNLLTPLLQRANARRKQRENYERLKQFAKSSSDWFWETDREFRFSYFSEQFESVSGALPEKLLGKTHEEARALGTNQETNTKFLKHLNNHEPFRNFDIHYFKPDGEKVFLSISGSPAFDKDGNFIGYRGAGSNITERKKVEEEIKEKDKLLLAAIESVDGGIAIFDTDERLVLHNTQYKTYFHDIADMIKPGTFYKDLVTGLAKSGFFRKISGTLDDWVSAHIEIFHKGETTIPHLDKYGNWHQNHFYKLSDGGTFLFSLNVTDRVKAIAEKNDSEQRLRDFGEYSSDWTWETDEHHRFTHLSKEHYTLVGTPPDKYLGKTRMEAIQPDTNDENWHQHLDHLEAHRPFLDFCYDEIIADGTQVAIRVSGKPVFNKNGNFAGYRGTGTNISEQKNLEKQLAHSQRLEAVGQLTGGVAHDFNNLMAIMVGNLESALSQTQPDQPIYNFITDALDAVDRGAALTQQLLSFSRKQNLLPKLLDANELVNNTIRLIERTLGDNIKINTYLHQGTGQVNIDGAMFDNALLNLAINARDAMPDGGTLTIKTVSIELDGETLEGRGNKKIYGPYALITVTDTGTGIDKQNIDRITEPFFTTKNVGEGSGLGLSMVYGFIHQSKGYINIQSEKGVGTTIALYLPITKNRPQQKEEKVKQLSFNTILKKKTILLVEDNKMVRETTSRTLSQFGYGIIEAEDGEAALDILKDKSSEIDIVFSDIIMPNNMSGIELAETVTAKYKKIKILLTSGYPERITGQNSDQPLKVNFLAKPYRKEHLVAAIEKTALEDPVN